MLNLFPTLLVFGLLAPFLIRIAVAVYFLAVSISDIKRLYGKKDGLSTKVQGHDKKSQKILAHIITWASFVGGILMFIGLYTQMAAIFLAATSLSYAIREPQKRVLYLLLFAMSLSLLFSGAGFFAFDLPL